MRDLDEDAKFQPGDALQIAEASLTVGETGIILVVGSLILGAIGAGLMLLFGNRRGNTESTR
jgi:hypothetical protein